MNAFNRQALDPANNVVIDACAGSGKTWLLVSRIIRLLLDGVAPGEILAITFTRKAQQEMAYRLREWLRYMALAPEPDLRRFLADRALEADAIDRLLPQARCLFEQFLAADPPMTIQTFHGWFLQLLKHVPLPGGWAGEQDVAERISPLLEEAWMRFAETLHQAPGSVQAQALNQLYRDYGQANIQRLLRDFVARRAEWWAYTRGQADPVGYALQQLAAELGADAGGGVEARLLADPGLRHDLQAYGDLLLQNTAADQEAAARLQQALQAGDPVWQFQHLHGVLCTAQNEPRVRRPSAAQAKRLGTAGEQRFLQLHETLSERLCKAFLARQEAAVYRLNEAALPLGQALLGHYQEVKHAHQVVDFTDIEWQASELLNHSAYAEYMQYKLDSRYRQILLDEFQDTNPLQWQVLSAWLQAAEAVQMRPGIFLVGDPKQSIYRFRRAEPRLFQRAADYLEQAYGAVRLSQDVSRRCAPAILEVVNRTFATGYDGFLPHSAHHGSQWGRVELLPLAVPAAAAEGGTEAAVDSRHAQEGALLAQRLRDLVGRWLITDASGVRRPAQYQDILLLVRSRTHLEAYEQALRAAGIPYVSSRQGGLLETLECRDLTALLTFLSAPFDPLSLMHALRAPLFAASDADLLLLAQANGATWPERLQAAGQASACLKRAASLIEQWRALADTRPVHDLLDCIYAEGDVLQRYRDAVPAARLNAVVENLHAFMELSLTLEAGRYPSLARFLDALAQLRLAPLEEAPNEGRLGEAGNAVQILTIHAAKGLEAPITWLLDAHQAALPEQDFRVLVDWPPASPRPRHFSLCGRTQARGAARAAYFQEEARQAAREAQNLLYVAMTRARQVLLLSGVEQKRAGETMYTAVQEGIGASDASGHQVWGASPALAPDSALAPVPCAPPLPLPHACQPVGSRQPEVQHFGRHFAARLQAVLEQLQQDGAAADWAPLQRRLRLDTPTLRRLVTQAQALLATPALVRFFDRACYQWARNGVSYQVPDHAPQSVDRLVECEDAVWVLGYSDYDAEGDTPEVQAACAQLQAHCQVLAPLFGGQPVQGVLLLAGGHWRTVAA